MAPSRAPSSSSEGPAVLTNPRRRLFLHQQASFSKPPTSTATPTPDSNVNSRTSTSSETSSASYTLPPAALASPSQTQSRPLSYAVTRPWKVPASASSASASKARSGGVQNSSSMLRQSPQIYATPPSQPQSATSTTTISNASQPNPLYTHNHRGMAEQRGSSKSGGGGGLAKEDSGSTVASGTSHATTAGAASHSSTEATSIPEDTPLDPSEAHFITARRAYLRGVQQQEDLERARKWTVRNGADWFDNFHGELSVPIGLQDEVPYPLLYGRGSHDWSMVQHLIRSRMFEHPTFTFSAKRTAKSKKPMPPIPTRVLDLGCGVYAPWILEMARFPGWQHTRFVGLDIAPVLLPLDRLPDHEAERMSFVQANLLHRLPFEDNTFDFVRIADVSHGMPEDQWSEVLDEARRVAGKGLIEIVAIGMAKELTSTVAIHVPEDEPADLLEAVKLRELAHLKEAINCLLQRRLISPFPLSHIPFALVMSSKMIDKSGTIPLPFHGNDADSDEELSLPDAHPVSQTSNLPSAAGAAHHWAADVDEVAGRVSLAAHTAHHCSLKERTYEDYNTSNPDNKISWKDHTDIYDSFKVQRTRQADLAKVLGARWNWHCEVDLQAERYLQRNVKALKEELATVQSDLIQGLQEPGTTSTSKHLLPTQEIERQIRETESELRTCKARLGKVDVSGGTTVAEPFVFEFGACIGGPN